MIGTLIYFIALANVDSGFESFHMIQKGRGAKSPKNLKGKQVWGKLSVRIRNDRTYIANGINQYPAGFPNENRSFPKTPIATEAELYC